MWKKLYALATCVCVSIPITVLAANEVYVGGDSIGIEVQYDGVMISGTYPITIGNETYDPSDHNIQNGDIIQKVNGTSISTMNDLYEQIAKYQNTVNEIPIQIKRGDMLVDVSLKTVYDQNKHTFQSGLYIKDKITGVGTMTFYDPSNQSFGALGHEIMDSDLKEIAPIDDGTIYPAQVTSITKAQPNVAGEKHASIDYNETLGNIEKNTEIGIYGHYDIIGNEELLLPWAAKEDVHVGPAKIYTVLQGSTIQAYDIEITKLHQQEEASVKGIEFQVIDPVLLSQTNGIVQGMSGSPIVQDNKLVGAITHVITSQPTTGYGVYIEWMLQEANTQ